MKSALLSTSILLFSEYGELVVHIAPVFPLFAQIFILFLY